MNICVLGDSVARGVVYDEAKEKYVFLKDSFINLFARDKNINIKNMAKFGCTTSKAVRIVDACADHFSGYDYTFIELGGNDCNYDWAKVAAQPDAPHLPNVPLNSFCSFYNDIIAKIKEKGSRPVLLSLPPIDSSMFFHWISKGLNKDNILHFLKDPGHIYRWHEGYNQMLYRIADENNAPLIDIRAAFLKEKDYHTFLCPDGMHPNEKGHRLILGAFEKSLSFL